MNMESMLEKAFLVKPDDTLSRVASEMAKKGKCEAFIFDGELRGIISLNDIVKRRISEPHQVKVSRFVKPVNPFNIDDPVENLINYMLVSEHKSLPVKKGRDIFSISKPKLLNFIKDEVFEGKKAKDVMCFPYCATSDDTLSTIISGMKDVGTDRIPVLDENGKFVGLADNVSLARFLVDGHRAKRGERFGDKKGSGEIGIGEFLRSDVLRVDPETDLKQIAKKLSKESFSVVIVEKDEKFAGMITIKDIFKLIGKSLETVYVRISGLDKEDAFIKSKIDEMVDNTITKLLKIVPLRYVAIHVETHKTGGRRSKYSVQGRFVTERGNFYASDHEWDPTKAMKLFLEKIERGVHKKLERERGY